MIRCCKSGSTLDNGQSRQSSMYGIASEPSLASELNLLLDISPFTIRKQVGKKVFVYFKHEETGIGPKIDSR